MSFRKIMLMTLLVLLITVPASFAADQVIKLDLNAVYGATSFHTEGAAEFAKLVGEYTNGSVVITVHPGGSLGFKGPELLKVVKDGQVPMSDILMGVVGGSESVFGISSLPRLVNSFPAAQSLYADCKPLYEKAAAKWKQKLLYAAPWPPSGLVTKKEINVTADLANLKTRTYDKNGAEFLQSLGASPVSLPWGEVYSSLTTGIIDSVLTSGESASNGKFWEVLKYFKNINYAYPLNMVTINLDYWNSLSPAQQQAMLKAAAVVEKSQWQKSEKRTLVSLATIKGQGMVLSNETPDFSKDLDAAAKKLVDAFSKESSPEVQAILAKYTK